MATAAGLSLFFQSAQVLFGRPVASETSQGHYQNKPNSEPKALPGSYIKAEKVADFLTFWQLLLNLFGLIGLMFTVLYAKMAWLAARDSADADNEALRLTKQSLRDAQFDSVEQARMLRKQLETAQHQAAIAVETATYQLRAYVDICDMKIRAHKHDTWGTQYDFTFHLKNFGQTPAFDVAGIIDKVPHPAKDGVTGASDLSPHTYGNIAPSDFIQGTMRFTVPVGDEPRITSGELKNTFLLKVSYLDIYKERRETELMVEAGDDYEPRSVGKTHRMT